MARTLSESNLSAALLLAELRADAGGVGRAAELEEGRSHDAEGVGAGIARLLLRAGARDRVRTGEDDGDGGGCH